MALPKRLKVGGSYLKGYTVAVGAPTGDYVLDMTLTTACAVNSITVIPDTYGATDYFTLQHLDADNKVISTLADTVYNVGAGAAWHFEFPALELLDSNHKLRLTYTNAAGKAMNIYTCVERIK